AIADQMGHTSTRFIAWYGRSSRQHAGHLCNVAALANGMKPRPVPRPQPSEAAPLLTAKGHEPQLPKKALLAYRLACLARDENPKLKSLRRVYGWLKRQPNYRE